MSITFQLNQQSLADFHRALNAYADSVLGKGSDEIVNTAALVLCYNAIRRTRFAQPSSLALLKYEKSVRIVQLRKDGQTRLNKKGQLIFLKPPKPGKKVDRRRVQYEATTMGFLIYVGREWKLGHNPRHAGSRAILMQKALAMANARASAAHYIQSGWLAAARILRTAVNSRVPGGAASIPRKKKGWGGAEISTRGSWGGVARAKIWNTSTNAKAYLPIHRRVMQTLAEDGLALAMEESTNALLLIVREKLARAAEKFNRDHHH